MVEFPFDLSKINMASVMDMVNKLKQEMGRIEEELAKIEVEAMVGGGMVTVKANARGEIISIVVDDELIEMKDKNMLQSLLVSAVNQALKNAKDRREEHMQKFAGGLGMPGWFA